MSEKYVVLVELPQARNVDRVWGAEKATEYGPAARGVAWDGYALATQGSHEHCKAEAKRLRQQGWRVRMERC